MSLIGLAIGFVAAVVSTVAVVAKHVALIGLAVQGIKAICGALTAIGKALGIIKDDMPPEDLGDRAIQAEEQGIKPEDFKDFDEYVERVKNFVPDPKRSADISTDEKLKKAAEVLTGQLVAANPSIEPELLASFEGAIGKNPELGSEKAVEHFAAAAKENGLETMLKDTVGYLDGSTTDEASLARGEKVVTGAMLESMPEGSTVNEAVAKIFASRATPLS